MRTSRKVLRKYAALSALVLAAALVSSGCANRAFYYPDARVYGTPSMPYEPVTFKSLDGTALSGWFVPALTNRIGTVVHFHGNAQNMTAHFAYVDWLPASGFDVFVFDYRGYGASQGRVSRQGIMGDGIAALNYVASRQDVDANRMAVLGQSLGGAVAVPALADARCVDVRALALDSTFNSYREMAQLKIKPMPLLGALRVPLAWWCVSGRHEPKDAIGKLGGLPLMMFHGTDDRVIPLAQGKRLYDGAAGPKRFVPVPGAGHTVGFVLPDDRYRRQLTEFLVEAMRHSD